MNLETYEYIAAAYGLGLPRLMACFAVLPIFSRQVLGGTLFRNGLVMSLGLFIFPITAAHIEPGSALIEAQTIIFIMFKEAILGLFIGFIAAIPFWAIEASGFFIDNQRGATLASTINPALGSQTTPTGILLTQALITLFFVGGSMLGFMAMLFQSFITWPVVTFFPGFNQSFAYFFYGQMALMLTLCVLMAAPVIIAMFIAEFGLALISRFAPQLNVFILALPIKSVIASAILVVYAGTLLTHFDRELIKLINIPLTLGPVLGSGP